MSFDLITDINFMRDTYFKSDDSLPSCNKMAGVDGVTPKMFKQDIHNNLRQLQEELRSGRYQHQKLKHHIIPRGDGERGRVIATPTQKDKLLQRVVYRYLTENVCTFMPDDKLGIATDVSYGVGKDFTPTAKQAVNNIIRVRSTKPCGVKTDISNFFNEIDRPLVMEGLSYRIGENRILSLMEQIVHAEIKGERLLLRQNGITRNRGLRQGMPLSPILASALLVDFDNTLNKRWFNAYRVADDILCLCGTVTQTERIQRMIEDKLEDLSLRISPLQNDGGKTRIFDAENTVKFLGINVTRGRNSNHYVPHIPEQTINKGYQKVRDIFSSAHPKHGTACISKREDSFQSTLAGYTAYFQDCTNYNSFRSQMRGLKNLQSNALIQRTFGCNPFENWSDEQKRLVGLPCQ